MLAAITAQVIVPIATKAAFKALWGDSRFESGPHACSTLVFTSGERGAERDGEEIRADARAAG